MIKKIPFSLVSALGSVFIFLGTVASVAPSCYGWFYAPRMPDKLKK